MTETALDTTNQNPSPSQVLNTVITTRLNRINVSMPAVIQTYDKEKRLVSVQPSLKFKLKNQEPKTLPIIQSVPVVWPRALDSGLYFPLKKGDSVTLLVQQRSIDAWVSSGGVVDPSDPRKFDLNDSVAIVGAYSVKEVLPVDESDLDKLVLMNNKTKIVLGEDGKLYLGEKGKTANEPLVLGGKLASFMTAFTDLLKSTPLGITTSPGNLNGINPNFVTSLEQLVTEYITTEQTNFLSLKQFGEK